MAHYVFRRDNGYGDYDFIADFDTMELTDYKEYAAQVDDRYMPYIDMQYMNSLGFYAVGISTLALRIVPEYGYVPRVRGFRPVGMPRPPRARGMAPRPMPGRPGPAPRPAPMPGRPGAAPRPEPMRGGPGDRRGTGGNGGPGSKRGPGGMGGPGGHR